MKFRTKKPTSGFTLVELLVILAIITILFYILLPTLKKGIVDANNATCISNLYQIGLQMQQYATDHGGQYPPGFAVTDPSGNPVASSGVGWANQLWPTYISTYALLHCPDDPTKVNPKYVSYAMNSNMAGKPSSQLTSPSATVMLFEVEGVTADPATLSIPGYYAAAGNGNNPTPAAHLTMPATSGTFHGVEYWLRLQSYLGGPPPPSPSPVHLATGGSLGNWYVAGGAGLIPQPDIAAARHSGSSNYLFADGHTDHLSSDLVSFGIDATSEYCFEGSDQGFTNMIPQNTTGPYACPGALPVSAQGTNAFGHATSLGQFPEYLATFSTK